MKEIYFDQAFPFLRYARIWSIYKDSDYNESMAYDNRLFLCIEGRGAICIEDKDYEMKKGTLIMWRAGKKYSYKTCPDEPMHLIGFNFDFTHESADKKLPIPPIAPTLFKKDDMTEQILFSDADILNHTVYIKNMYETKPKFFEMKEEFELNKKYSRAVCSAMLLELMVQIVRFEQDTTANQSEKRADDILEYIHMHYGEKITNELLGKIFSYHPNHINRIILNLTGMSTHKYILNYRINRAIDLMQSSGASVSQAAVACGFRDVSHFSKCFHAKTGHSASEFLRK